MSSRAWLIALCVVTAAAFAPGRLATPSLRRDGRARLVIHMGRKFENNKLKMAKVNSRGACQTGLEVPRAALSTLDTMRPRRPTRHRTGTFPGRHPARSDPQDARKSRNMIQVAMAKSTNKSHNDTNCHGKTNDKVAK